MLNKQKLAISSQVPQLVINQYDSKHVVWFLEKVRNAVQRLNVGGLRENSSNSQRQE